MIQKIVKKMDLKKSNSIAEDLKFWLNKSPEERVSTVEYLRRQYHGSTVRLQRVIKVIQHSSS